MSDSLGAREAINGCAEFAQQIPETLADLCAIAQLLTPSLQEPVIHGDQLAESHKRINSEHFKGFRKSMKENDLWKAVMAAATFELQLQAKDHLAYQKLKRAEAILVDNRMPRLERPEKPMPEGDTDQDKVTVEAIVVNFSSIADGSVFCSYAESVSLVMECLALWGRYAQSTALPQIKEWAARLVSSLRFVDEVMFLFLQALASQSGLGVVAPGGEEVTDAAWPGAEVLTKLQLALDAHAIDNEPLQDCVSSFLRFVEALSPWGQSEIGPMKDELVQTVAQNMKCRDAMMTTLVHMTSMPEFPGGSHAAAKTAVADWVAKRAHGKQRESFIEQSIILLDLVAKMRDSAPSDSIRPSSEDDGVHMLLDAGDCRDDFVGSFKIAMTMHARLCRWPLWRTLQGLVTGSLQEVAECCAQSLNLDSLGTGRSADAGAADDLSIHMRAFFDPACVSAAVAACGKVFSPGSNKTWPTSDALQLLANLCDKVPPEDFRVDLRCFASALVRPLDGVVQTKALVGHLVAFEDRLVKIASIMAYICLRFVQGTETVVRDYALKEEIEVSISLLRSEVRAAIDWFGQEGDAMAIALRGVMDVDTRLIQSWLENAKTVTAMLCSMMHAKHVDATSSLASELDTLTPKFGHLITDDKFNIAWGQEGGVALAWESLAEKEVCGSALLDRHGGSPPQPVGRRAVQGQLPRRHGGFRRRGGG